MPAVPEASFLNFLGGLAAQALMQLGEVPNPLTGGRESNPAFARYTVQLMTVLRDKTRGNLSAEEAAYLESAIGDLTARLAKVEETVGESRSRGVAESTADAGTAVAESRGRGVAESTEAAPDGGTAAGAGASKDPTSAE